MTCLALSCRIDGLSSYHYRALPCVNEASNLTPT